MEILKFQNREKDWWWCHGEMWCDIFDKYVKFNVVEAAEYEDVQKCAEYLNNLPESLVERLCLASIKYCIDFSEYVGNDVPKFDKYKDVLKLISNAGVSIPNQDSEGLPALHLTMNCEWEEEHGMSWAIAEGNIIYVGPYSGDPTDINYFKKRLSESYA